MQSLPLSQQEIEAARAGLRCLQKADVGVELCAGEEVGKLVSRAEMQGVQAVEEMLRRLLEAHEKKAAEVEAAQQAEDMASLRKQLVEAQDKVCVLVATSNTSLVAHKSLRECLRRISRSGRHGHGTHRHGGF